MKKASVAVTVLFFSLVQRGLAGETNPPVPSPAELDDPALPAVVSEIGDPDRSSIMRLRPQVFEAQKSAESSGGSLDDFVGLLRINPAFLTKPADPIVRAGGAVLGVGLPREMARLQVGIAGEQYELFFFDEQKDSRYGLRHVTMKVLNHEDSYARFSVDDRNGLIYGAIHTPGRTLRIVPTATPGQQEVYIAGTNRLSSQAAALAEQTNPAVRLLAWRHEQLESVATIRPQYAEARYESRSSYVRGGNLGSLKRVNAKAFVRAAAKLASITQFKGNETFQITETLETDGGGQRVRMHQVIGGALVDASNEVTVDANGKILELATALVASDWECQKFCV
jgi:hypothetical protein